MSIQGPRPSFQRLAIVNRGEPAMRLINAVREWNAEGRPRAARHRRVHGGRPARHVRARGRRGGADRPGRPADAAFEASPYLDYAELERALRECRADAVWPGWGFVSEKAEFAELCDRLGITFIGPSAEVMRRLGDKIESKRLAEQVGVPLAAWSGGPVAGLEEAREQAETIGYPLMVKATAGGGGRGIRLVGSARGTRRGLRARELGGVEDRRGRDGVPGAGDPRRPPRRGAGRSPTPLAPCGRWGSGTAACSAATRR